MTSYVADSQKNGLPATKSGLFVAITDTKKEEILRLPLGVPSGIRTHDIQNHNLTL